MDGNTTLGVLFGLGLGAASCLVVAVNGQTSPAPAAFEVASSKENVSARGNMMTAGIAMAQHGQVDVLVVDSARRPLED